MSLTKILLTGLTYHLATMCDTSTLAAWATAAAMICVYKNDMMNEVLQLSGL